MEPPPAATVKRSAVLAVQDAGAAAGIADLDVLLDRFAVLVDGALQRAFGAGFVDGGQFASADAQALLECAVGLDLLLKRLFDGVRFVHVGHDGLLLNGLKARLEARSRFHAPSMNLLRPSA